MSASYCCTNVFGKHSSSDRSHYLIIQEQLNYVLHDLKHFEVLKLINNSTSLNKGNHDRLGVWISDLN